MFTPRYLRAGSAGHEDARSTDLDEIAVTAAIFLMVLNDVLVYI
jgi:hypothetical protein